MRNQISRHRFPLVALMAIAGMLWGVPEVKAYATHEAPKVRSCCARQAPADCGCCTPADDEPVATLPSPTRVPGTGFAGIRPSSPSTCVCSPSSPARQGERRETRTSEEDSAEASFVSLPIAHSGTPSLASGRASRPRPLPSHTPLYLRVEHLVI